MDDTALMKEYGLAPSGLQSLFDKLVTGGYLDLSEIQARMPGFMGTVNIDDPFFPAKDGATGSVLQPQAGKSGAWINAQEAARDIRAGLDDAALMEKYRLTSRGLRSMADKLISVGLITQADLDLRRVGLQENTVALSEEMLDLFESFRQLAPVTSERVSQPQASKPEQIEKNAKKVTSLDESDEKKQQAEQPPPVIASRSYDDAPKHSAKSKAMIIAVCISLVIVSLVLAWELLAWHLIPGF
jgi:hypothetical protein